MTSITLPVGGLVRHHRRNARRRDVVVAAILALLALVTAMISLAIGDFVIPLPDLVAGLFGQADPKSMLVIWQLRMPRVLTAAMVGLCLGLSGALFQSLVRNPLASPDVIGITSGASAAAVIGIVLFGITGIAISAFSFAGALVAAVTIYLLAWRGGVAGFRFVLTGIAVAALLSAVVSYLMTWANVRTAQEALFWLTGSLHMRRWGHALPLSVLTVILCVATACTVPRLRALQLGDDAATALGTAVEPTRRWVILVAVGLAAAATAAAGPVAFVALLSGAFGRLLSRGKEAVLPAGLIGMLVVLVADLAGQHLLPGINLPVGVITGVVGAPYLVWLLLSSNAAGRGE